MDERNYYPQNTDSARKILASQNTRVYTFYSDTASITISAWNEQLSMKIFKAIGTDQNGFVIYEKERDKGIFMSMKVPEVVALLEGIQSKIVPAYMEQKEASIATMFGTNKVVQPNGFNQPTQNVNGKKLVEVSTDGADIYLTVTIGIGDDGVGDPVNSIKHKFATKEYYENYDVLSGTGDKHVSQVDFVVFIEKLKSVYLLGSIIPHAIKYQNKLWDAYDKMFRTFKSKNYYPQPNQIGTNQVVDQFDMFTENS